MCTGKIYYELEQQREALKRDDVAILRLEQLYPLQEQAVQLALAPYAAGIPVMWVQEEPENMGAWRYLRVRFRRAHARRSSALRLAPPRRRQSGHRLGQDP